MVLPNPSFASVGIVGAGTMGQGIAQIIAQAGVPVRIYDKVPGRAQEAVKQAAAGIERQVQKGRLSAEDAEEALHCLSPVESLKDLGPAALVIEAAVENMGVKQQIFRE